jgi:hypothetical protein
MQVTMSLAAFCLRDGYGCVLYRICVYKDAVKGIDFEASTHTSSSFIGRFLCREPAHNKSSVYAELDATTIAADGHTTYI